MTATLLVRIAEATPGIADQSGCDLAQARSCVTHLGSSSEPPSSAAGSSATLCLASPKATFLPRVERRAAEIGLRTFARLALRNQPAVCSHTVFLLIV